MQLACPNCSTTYQIAATAIGASGRSVRCARCQTVWFAPSPGVIPAVADLPAEDSAQAPPQEMASAVSEYQMAGAAEQPWRLPMPGVATWLALLGLASLSTALAYIVFFQILRRSGATNVMLVTLLIPVTAILLGWLVLGEPISVREIAGAIVIGTALLVIDGRAVGMLQRVA